MLAIFPPHCVSPISPASPVFPHGSISLPRFLLVWCGRTSIQTSYMHSTRRRHSCIGTRGLVGTVYDTLAIPFHDSLLSSAPHRASTNEIWGLSGLPTCDQCLPASFCRFSLTEISISHSCPKRRPRYRVALIIIHVSTICSPDRLIDSALADTT